MTDVKPLPFIDWLESVKKMSRKEFELRSTSCRSEIRFEYTSYLVTWEKGEIEYR